MTQGETEDPDHVVEMLWRARGTRPKPESRPGLSLDRIVHAGIELADVEGLTGLSMRKVAERLGFTTMSLYRHVPGRAQLVDLMCDAVAGETETDQAPPEGNHWRIRLEACARNAWELRRRHPWLAQVRGRRVPGPHTVARYEQMLDAVADTGLLPTEVIAVVGLVGRFVDSEALLLQESAEAERHSGISDEDWWASRDTLFEQLDDYPTLTRLWEEGGFGLPENPFEFGLARLLDGIELLIHQRYETSDNNEACVVCGTPVDRSASGRPRMYCSASCRQQAYRKRKARQG
ncbi:TetR/AcrR family transcriptional regulator [Nocardia sp. NBC_00508]|uniref:TetR/AcrR family transcriptional regulator n=1 Tax=Nocardia sp. NBC_00508 TaxID=2975992 RepID=UPI002E81F6BD|nr:TetR/AcrR family transcriptional regulator [Nocardia sp. NBC_00508]WUD65963.1 TetR/AcrR family transcriptional regulator [Nocardia sp. NBC_00508]